MNTRILYVSGKILVSLVIPILLLSQMGSASPPAELCPHALVKADTSHAFLGMWDYQGSHVHFVFALKSDSSGYLADDVDTFPFTYSLDTNQDPALLDLIYQVDMAFGRYSHTLVRLERTEEGDLLHWVSCHSDSGPPEWPESRSDTPAGVTWLTFQRIKP